LKIKSKTLHTARQSRNQNQKITTEARRHGERSKGKSKSKSKHKGYGGRPEDTKKGVTWGERKTMKNLRKEQDLYRSYNNRGNKRGSREF